MMIRVTENLRGLIRTERKAHKVRGDDLSRSIGKSPSYISRIENGKTATMDDSLIFPIFKNILQVEDENVQSFIDSFIHLTPDTNDIDYLILSLSDNKKSLLPRFLSALNDEANSYQFISCVLQAIDFSNKPVESIEDDDLDVFTATLATTMQHWKRRKAQEREEFKKLRESIPDYDDLY